ncbi:MAG: TonB-dependent receptor [Pseudomonadales bacterium]
MKFNKNRNLYYALLGVQLSAALVSGAQANELEEVIVTAEKRQQSLQDVPISVSAITGDSLDKLKMESAADIASQIPNLQVSAPYGDVQPIFSIRGISMVDYNTNQASPIGVYVDEVSIGASFMQGLQLFDLQRVEVLRGPQGTLYGKNTTGGAINFITRAPTFVSEAELTASVGNYGRRKLKGAGELPLIEDTLGVRIAFSTVEVDGFHDNHMDGKADLSATDNSALRISALYQNDNFDATLRLFKGTSDANALAVVPIGTDPGGTNRLGYLRPENYNSWEGEHNKPAPFTVDTKGAALTFNLPLGDYTFTSITAFTEGNALNQADTDGSPVRLLEIDFHSDSEQVTQDFRLTSNLSGPFNFIAGLYYSNDELDVQNDYDLYFDSPADAFFIGQGYTQERESYALYSSFDFDVGESTTLTLGLRYTKDDGELRDFYSIYGDINRDPLFNLIPFLDFAYDPDAVMATKNYQDSEWTGKLGIDHQLNEDSMLYASYSRGYRSSAFNGGAVGAEGDVTTANPEFVNAFELGYKSQFMDNRLQLNGAVFFYDYTDQQFINVIGINQVLENAGSSEIYGLDLELQALITDKLTLKLGLGLVNTEFKTLVLNDPISNTDQDYSGNELQQAPKVNFNGAIDYVLGQWSAGELVFHLDTTYQDEQYFSAYNDAPGFENIRADSYWQSNLLLRFDDAADRYSVSMWMTNVEENDEPIYALSLSQAYGYDYTAVGAPRQYGIDVTVRF